MNLLLILSSIVFEVCFILFIILIFIGYNAAFMAIKHDQTLAIAYMMNERISKEPTSSTKADINELKSLLHAYHTRELTKAEHDRICDLMGMEKYNLMPGQDEPSV